MEYLRADQLSFDPHPQMGKIFADGFYPWLKFFSKDKEKLARAFAHIFDLRCFFLAVHDGEIAAFTACTDGEKPSIQLDEKILCRVFGFFRGKMAYKILNKHMVAHSYPFALSRQTGSIEFVATAQAFRGKGTAFGLVTHVIQNMPYSEYVLEVAGSNTIALRLYEKLGFHEFMRVKAPRGSGENYFIYMRFCKEKSK